MILWTYIGRNPYQWSYFYTLLTSEYPCCTHQTRVKKVSVDILQEAYSVAHSTLHHKTGNTLIDDGFRMFIVRGTGARSCALSFLRRFQIIDDICAALFVFIYSAVRVTLAMTTVLVKWRFYRELWRFSYTTYHTQHRPHMVHFGFIQDHVYVLQFQGG